MSEERDLGMGCVHAGDQHTRITPLTLTHHSSLIIELINLQP